MSKKNQLLILILFCNFFILKSEAQNTTGTWRGNIELPGVKLQMIFNISVGEDGHLSATLDVPQQGAAGLPIKEAFTKADSLFLKIPAIMGNFMGKFVSADSIAGEWRQANQVFILNLSKTGKAKQLHRPQTPQPPFSYLTEEVEYINPMSGFKLAGTLTLPKDANHCPAVILITGSGAQDRDETISEHKPFFVIADYFAKNGIAVLRVDDRGIGGSEGDVSMATSEDFATDVLQGVNFLKKRTEINPTKIGLIGHSEGGLVAPMVANITNDVSFIIMMAGPGTSGDSILMEQTELISKAAGLPDQAIATKLFLTRGIINIIKTETDADKRSESLRNAVSGGMYNMMDDDRKNMINNQLEMYDNNWFRFFVSYDPYNALTKIQCPVLAMIGEKDIQVPPISNLSAIEKALKEGGNSNFKTMKLPNLNHLFQNCETGSPMEYSKIEETISPEVLKIMKDWILEITEK